VLRAALGNPAAGATPPWPVEEVTVLVVSTSGGNEAAICNSELAMPPDVPNDVLPEATTFCTCGQQYCHGC
jgi:hypothetical protein